MRRIKKFLSLSADEQKLFIGAVLLLPLIVLSLRLIGYRRTESLLLSGAETRTPSATPSEDLATALAAARTVRRAANNGLVKASCLPRALLLARVLRRRGVDCVIRFGVQGERTSLEAHAWVECNGARIDGDRTPADGYLELEAAGRPIAAVPGPEDRLT